MGVRKDREIPAVSYDFGPELFDEAENHEADGRIIVLEFSRPDIIFYEIYGLFCEEGVDLID